METTPEVIVSLTSWKGRLYSEIVQLAIFSLLQQKTKYNYKVLLVLSTDEFPGKERDVPKNLLKIAQAEPKFDIMWTKKNTRALKKLDPAMQAYPGLPVITTDDDIIVRDNFVESFMDCHRKHPKDAIYAHVWDFPANHAIKISGWGRLFPPRSLYPLDNSLFDRIFRGLEDDVWNGIRVWLAGTKVRKLGSWPFIEQVPIGNTAFHRTYSKVDPSGCYRKLLKALSAN